MRSASRFNLCFSIIFLIQVAIAAPALAETISKPVDNSVAATVNGRPIYLNELKKGTDSALAKYKKYGAFTISDETKKRIQLQELDHKVEFELLVQAGENLIGKEIEGKVEERIKATNALQAAGDHNLKPTTSNLNTDNIRQQVRRQLLADEYLVKRGIQDLHVTEPDAKKYYEQNKQSFQEAESVKVSHILIILPKNPKPEDISKASKEIENIHAEIIAGKDFAELARKHSKCASAPNGGDLGYINHGDMPKDFDKVAFSLKTGEVSDVVRTRHGFHIIKAFDKKPARIQEFSEVKGFIEKLLIKQVQADRIKEIVAELRQKARVEVLHP